VVRTEEAYEIDYQRALLVLTTTTAPQTAPAHGPRTTHPPTLVDTVTDIRAPPKSNKRTATEATLQEKRATDHSKRKRTDSATDTQRLHQSMRDNSQDAAGPLNTHNARKKARAITNARKHLDPEPALPPGQPPHPTNATSTPPMERMRTFFTRACAQTAHNFTVYQPEESSTLAIPLWT
jgi:hypothetical protein